MLDLLVELGYVVTAHDLVIESPLDLRPDEIVAYCDEATERFRAEGKHQLVGILYLHATHEEQRSSPFPHISRHRDLLSFDRFPPPLDRRRSPWER